VLAVGDAGTSKSELKGKGRWPVAGAPGTVVSQMFQQPGPVFSQSHLCRKRAL